MKRTVIAFVAMVISLSSCKYNGYDRDASSSVKDSLLVDYMTYVSQFSEMRIMQNTAEWNPSLDKRIHPSWKQESLDAGAWAILQNAKAETHRRSIPLRAVASRGLCRRMDALEKSFDEAFELMVTQEYYMRCFEDVFDETVPPKIKALYQ